MSRLSIAASVAAALALAGAGSAVAADLVIESPVDTAPVAESGDWYVSLFAGGVWPNAVETVFNGVGDVYTVNFDPGYTLGIAVGTHVFDNLRGEVELSYGRVEANEFSYPGQAGPAEGPLSTLYLLGNLWYELDTGSTVTPYIGGGVGAGYATADTSFGGQPFGYGPGGVGLAYQLGAGVQFGLTDSIAVDVGYRFKSILGVDFDDNDGSDTYADGDVSSHVLQAGLKFSF